MQIITNSSLHRASKNGGRPPWFRFTSSSYWLYRDYTYSFVEHHTKCLT